MQLFDGIYNACFSTAYVCRVICTAQICNCTCARSIAPPLSPSVYPPTTITMRCCSRHCFHLFYDPSRRRRRRLRRVHIIRAISFPRIICAFILQFMCNFFMRLIFFPFACACICRWLCVCVWWLKVKCTSCVVCAFVLLFEFFFFKFGGNVFVLFSFFAT